MGFVPDDFEVPELLEHERFRVRPLTVHDVVKDYDAVMTSRDHLWRQFGQAWGWPSADLTLEQDLIDLGWHQKEFQRRSSFDYAVMSPDETRLLGCVYVDPPEAAGYDAEVWLWVRASELDSGLDAELYATVRRWIEQRWPFRRVAYPGRDGPAPTPGATPGPDLRRLYRRWMLELWNGDLSVAAEIVTDDFVVHQARADGAASEEVRGPEAVARMVREGHAPFDELTFRIEVGPVVEGDMVAARWLGRGRYRGGMPGATAAAGTPVAFGGIDLLRARDGRFAEYWVSSDGLQLMAQLGALGPGP